MARGRARRPDLGCEKNGRKRLDSASGLSLKTRMLPRTRDLLTGFVLVGLSALALAEDPPLTPEQISAAVKNGRFLHTHAG
jgi:hypothetical protein